MIHISHLLDIGAGQQYPSIRWQSNVERVVLPVLKEIPHYSNSFPDRHGYLSDPFNSVTKSLLQAINDVYEWSSHLVYLHLLYPYLVIQVSHNIRSGNSKLDLLLDINLVIEHYYEGTLPPSFFYAPCIRRVFNRLDDDMTCLSGMVLPACLESLVSAGTEAALSTTPLFTHQQEGLRWLQHMEQLIDYGLPVGEVDSTVPVPSSDYQGIVWDPLTQSLSVTPGIKLPLYACGGMVGDGIGSGKTLQMLSLVVAERHKALLSRVTPRPGLLESRATLVVCGKQLAHQWHDQVKEHFKHLSLKVVMITDKLHHERVTLEDVLTADLVIVTMSFLMGTYYRDHFIQQRVTPDMAPLSVYLGYLLSVKVPNRVVLEQIHFRRLILDEADMYLYKLPYADAELEHAYQRRLSQHCRVNCSRKTEPFVYVQCLQADFRWIVTSTANFSDISQQSAFVSFLGLSVGTPNPTPAVDLFAAPRTVQPVQPLTLDRVLTGPTSLERTLVKNAFKHHLLLARSQKHIFESMSLPPLDVDVIWIEYSVAERNLVRGALEMDTDYNFRRHVHAFPLLVTQGNQGAVGAVGGTAQAMSVQQAGEVMMGAQRRRLLELEQAITTARSGMEEVERVQQTSPDIITNLLNHRHLQLSNEIKTAENTIGAIQRSMQFLEASLNSQDPCTICMDAVTNMITKCGHKFCGPCLQRSLQERPRCPTCRSPCALEQCIPLINQVEPPSGGEDYGSRFRALLEYLRAVRVTEPAAQFVIFSEWAAELQKQATLLTANGFRVAEVKGNTSVCQANVRQFQEGALDVLFLSLQSMASGLHLVNANYVLILTPLGAPFERAEQVERQAIGRCHRVGQTKPVHVRHFLVRDSLEQEIWEARQNGEEKKI